MRNQILEYLSALKLEQLDYGEIDKLKKNWLKIDPMIHIPQWKYFQQKKYEIIVSDIAGLIFGKHDEVSVQFGEEEEKLIKTNIFKVIDHIESIFHEKWQYYFGFLAYDLYRQIEPVETMADFYELPDYYLIFPAKMLLINHTSHEVTEYSYDSSTLNLECVDQNNNDTKTQVRFNETKNAYLEKINHIKQLIAEGEVYQINYTMRLSLTGPNSGYSFFRKLYQINPAPFSVYARLPHCEIISNSPERFVMMDDTRVITEPIKGTIKRAQNRTKDEKYKGMLKSSEKDSAELSMIVDLLRNDLSKVCIPGSVEVRDHKRLETFSNVHHLISTIQGKLCQNISFADLLKAVFPGGSISGCPKIAALQGNIKRK